MASGIASVVSFMKRLKPFFTYYGGKWRAAKHYPEPMFDAVVEPFAGSAGYALRYADRQVYLNDMDDVICGVWRYLIAATPKEIMALPDLAASESVDDLNLPQEARWLIGFWLNKGAASPCKTPSSWMRSGISKSWWGPEIRERIAQQVPHIRHWKVTNQSYEDLGDIEATWFIDPPYQKAGKHYRKGSGEIDFAHLAGWCQDRRGQVMVCEHEGAEWLPFKPFRTIRATPSKTGGHWSKELLWTNGVRPLSILDLL